MTAPESMSRLRLVYWMVKTAWLRLDTEFIDVDATILICGGTKQGGSGEVDQASSSRGYVLQPQTTTRCGLVGVRSACLPHLLVLPLSMSALMSSKLATETDVAPST